MMTNDRPESLTHSEVTTYLMAAVTTASDVTTVIAALADHVKGMNIDKAQRKVAIQELNAAFMAIKFSR